MAKEICISSTPHETRLAILEDDQLAEIYYERENEYTLAGSIYNGRVTRVLPGMQSAFVNIGLERDAFLYVTDFLELEDPEESDELEKAAVSGGNQPPREVRGGRPSQKSEPKQDARPAVERPRLTVEPLPESDAAPIPSSGSLSLSEPVDGRDEDSAEPGAKRWRGRRRRRGGRGSAAASAGQSQNGETPSISVEPEAEADVAPEIKPAPAPQPTSILQRDLNPLTLHSGRRQPLPHPARRRLHFPLSCPASRSPDTVALPRKMRNTALPSRLWPHARRAASSPLR